MGTDESFLGLPRHSWVFLGRPGSSWAFLGLPGSSWGQGGAMSCLEIGKIRLNLKSDAGDAATLPG